MHFLPTERIALFIDGANLYSASRNLGFDVDYRNLLEYFRKKAHVIRAYYYSAVLETEEYSPLKPLTDWLAYNGYTLVTKPAKEFTDATGRRRVKGNMDIELAVDMLELAPTDRPCGAVQRRFRFPPSGGGGAAQGRARLRGLVDPHQPADGRRRAAPAGRPVPGTGRHRTGIHPPPDRAAAARRCAAAPDAGRAARPSETLHAAERRALDRSPRRRRAAARLPALPAPGRLPRSQPGGQSGLVQRARCRASARSTRRCWSSGMAPGRARRQPHRPAVHRRLRRRAAVRDAAATSAWRAAATAPTRRRAGR